MRFTFAIMLLLGFMGGCRDLPLDPGAVPPSRNPSFSEPCYPNDPQRPCTLKPISGGWSQPGDEPEFCDLWPDDPFCGGFGGSGGGGTYSGGGGSGGATANPKDSGACPNCGERQPLPEELKDMEDQLSKVQCVDLRELLRSMLSSSRILVYTQADGMYSGWDSVSDLIYISRPKHWLLTGLDSYELTDSMVHEAVHKFLGHSNGQPRSQSHASEFAAKMAECGFPYQG